MSGLEYLNNIILKYTPRKPSVLQNFFPSNLQIFLRPWAKAHDINVVLSGSTIKKTAISLSSDLDYFVELPYVCNFTLEDMYEGLYKTLSSKYSNIRKQNVSIGIKVNDLKIDITPGIKWRGNTNQYSIYKSKSETWSKTNITLHNREISESGRTSEIKLLKIWRELYRLDFPSIYLEYLLKDHILLGKNKDANCLEVNFIHTLNELAKEDSLNPLYFRIIDPSSSNNIFSDLINSQAKQNIIQQARKSTNERCWNNIVF